MYEEEKFFPKQATLKTGIHCLHVLKGCIPYQHVNVLGGSIRVHYLLHVRYKCAHSIVVGRLIHKQNDNNEE